MGLHPAADPGRARLDAEYMGRAIQASRAALEAGDMPYGAVLVSAGGELLQVSRNRQVSSGDCTAHAEVVVVREASARLGPAALLGSTVYASGEPCAMCSGAMFWAGVRRVVWAAPSDAMAALFGGNLLPIRCAQALAGAVPPVQVDGPVEAEAALRVLREAAGRPAQAR
jgi:tRNA(Arg) A34 adenosine deaminase TadA